jgi:hypothetical protein
MRALEKKISADFFTYLAGAMCSMVARDFTFLILRYIKVATSTQATTSIPAIIQ